MVQIHCFGLYDSLCEVDGATRLEVPCPRQEARVTLISPDGGKMLVRARCTDPTKPTWSIRTGRADTRSPLPDWPVTKMVSRGGGGSSGLTISAPEGTRAEGTADVTPVPLRSVA